MFEDFNTMRIAIKHGRTFQQQKYRDELVKSLKELKKEWKKEWKKFEELYESLSKKKWTIEYAENQISCWRTLRGDLAKNLIDSWKLDFVVKNLSKFKWLGTNIAAKLFDEWYYLDVARNIMSFESLDKTIFDKIIEKFLTDWYSLYNCWRFVARNLDRFEWLDHKEVAETLIDRWCGDELAMNWQWILINLNDWIIMKLQRSY